jgi:serine/threonine-protein kinase
MYSLGATLYHAITGHVPFEAATNEEVLAAHVQTPLTPPNLVVPAISEATSTALLTAMAKRPDDRFKTYDEMQMALEAARSQLMVRRFSQDGGAAPGKSWWH